MLVWNLKANGGNNKYGAVSGQAHRQFIKM